MAERLNVGRSLQKIDALALAAGSARFTDDFRFPDCLELALLYSDQAHAEIEELDTSAAQKVPGVVDVFDYRNAPAVLHTTAGQGYPEPSPYDTLLFDRTVRYVGDRVAMVAAESRQAAEEALRRIKVRYRPLEPLFDPERAMEEGAPRIHRGAEHAKITTEYRPERNLAAALSMSIGETEKGFAEADFIVEGRYTMQPASHCAIEPHAALAGFDERGRLVIITSTQVPFHCRRIVGMILGLAEGMIRVIKPRVGGGFGGKQEVFLEPLAALAAWRTKRPVRLVLSRREVFVSSRTRHAMRIDLKAGCARDGRITTLTMDCLMNAGAYGTHALTVLSNAGAKVLPLFNKIENLRFNGRTVYTNLPVGGAYRGYGATQGYFAFNQHLDIIARASGQDLPEYCKRWHIREGEGSKVFEALGEGKQGVAQVLRSCRLDECLERGAEAIGWREKRDRRLRRGERVAGVGMAIAMQGSGIPKVDMAAADMKMNGDGSFNLLIGATDIGTGSDTVLAQIAAEVLRVPLEKIIVLSSDTDLTPFDVGAYASSTTYVSGGAVERCARRLKEQILEAASRSLGAASKDLELEGGRVTDAGSGRSLSLEEIATRSLYSRDQAQIQAQASYTAPESPPPFIAQFAEVEVDPGTGAVRVARFVSAVDCGRPINPRLAEGQVEGSVVNAISYALWEDYRYDAGGRLVNPRFWEYKIFTAADIPEIRTILVDSNEESGPFGAKSVGEIAMNGPAPAIANAIYDAVGVRVTDTPITPEKVWRLLQEKARREGP